MFTAVSLQEWGHRVRFVAVTVVACTLLGMVAWFFPFDDAVDRSGTPLGGDYVMLYVAGRSALEGRFDQLYDESAQVRRLAALFPTLDVETSRLPYRYPPIVAMVMMPLAGLPYGWSFALFTLTSISVGGLAFRSLLRAALDPNDDLEMTGEIDAPHEATCRQTVTAVRSIAWTALLGWPVVWEVILGGQLSLFGLGALSTCLTQLHRGRMVFAGGCLALAAYKPNLLLFVALGIVLKYPRTVVGGGVVGLLLLAVQYTVAGPDCLEAYFELSQQLALRPWGLETPFWKVHGLGSWMAMIMPAYERKVLLGIGFVTTVLMVWQWRRRTMRWTDPFAISLLVMVNALCNPYEPIYDLVLCVVPAVSLVGGIARQYGQNVKRWLPLILGIAYIGPHLSQGVSLWFGYQCFPLLLLVITGLAAWRFFIPRCGVDTDRPATTSPTSQPVGFSSLHTD